MSDKIKITIGVLLIILLLGAILFVYLRPTTFFSGLGFKKDVIKNKETIILNDDFADPEKYTEITVNDIVDGSLLMAEMKNAKPFDEDTLQMRYRREDIGDYNSKLLINDDDFVKIKDNWQKSPFRNLYFYKIKSGEKWLTILGQQVRNSDGSSTFLHMLIHQGEDIYSWGSMNFGFQPLIVVLYRFFDYVAPKEFFSPDPQYYEKGSEIDQLITQWQQTGIVPEALSRRILFAEIKM